MINNINRCMKHAKKNSIRKQCSKIERNLRKKHCKRTYQLLEYLATVKQKQAYYPILLRKMAHRRKHAELMDRILLQLQGQFRCITTELSQD